MRKIVLSITSACLMAPVTGALAASEAWSYAGLHDDVRLSELLNSEVQSRDERSMGRLRDVLFDEEGSVSSGVVEFDAGMSNSSVAMALMDWNNIDLAPDEQAVVIGIGNDDDETTPVRTEGTSLREVIGRQVSLENGDAFGRVADVLMNTDDKQPSALLVEADQQMYALPVNAQLLATVSDVIEIDMSREHIESLGAFGAEDQAE